MRIIFIIGNAGGAQGAHSSLRGCMYTASCMYTAMCGLGDVQGEIEENTQ